MVEKYIIEQDGKPIEGSWFFPDAAYSTAWMLRTWIPDHEFTVVKKVF